MTREQRRARRALLKLLSKLGIKSAGSSTPTGVISPLAMEDLMDDMMEAYGQPDQIFMSGDALKNLLSVMGPSPAQAADKEGPVQSEEAPADKRGR